MIDFLGRGREYCLAVASTEALTIVAQITDDGESEESEESVADMMAIVNKLSTPLEMPGLMAPAFPKVHLSVANLQVDLLRAIAARRLQLAPSNEMRQWILVQPEY